MSSDGSFRTNLSNTLTIDRAPDWEHLPIIPCSDLKSVSLDGKMAKLAVIDYGQRQLYPLFRRPHSGINKT